MPIVQSVPTVSIGTGFPDSTSPATPKSEMILPPQKRTFETNLTSNLYHLEPSRRGSLSTPFSNGEVLHLLVLANPCLDVIDDTVKLLIISGVTHDPGHQLPGKNITMWSFKGKIKMLHPPDQAWAIPNSFKTSHNKSKFLHKVLALKTSPRTHRGSLDLHGHRLRQVLDSLEAIFQHSRLDFAHLKQSLALKEKFSTDLSVNPISFGKNLRHFRQVMESLRNTWVSLSRPN